MCLRPAPPCFVPPTLGAALCSARAAGLLAKPQGVERGRKTRPRATIAGPPRSSSQGVAPAQAWPGIAPGAPRTGARKSSHSQNAQYISPDKFHTNSSESKGQLTYCVSIVFLVAASGCAEWSEGFRNYD